MTARLNNICPKCEGHMDLDRDKNLHCLMCGKILHMQIRRSYDSRKGKIRDNKKKVGWGDLDWLGEMGREGVRNVRTSDNDSTLARQRSLGTRSPTLR